MTFEEFDPQVVLGKEKPHCEGCKPEEQ